MPPTTGGRTRGSRTSERAMDWPRNSVRARTRAIGTPKTMHRTVLMSEVRRLSSRAAREESEVMRVPKLPHSIRVSMATRGRTTNNAPTAAGTNTHAGSPSRGRPHCGRRGVSGTRGTTGRLRLGEPGRGEDALTRLAGDGLQERGGERGVLAALEGRDRVGVDGGRGLGELDALDLGAGALD